MATTSYISSTTKAKITLQPSDWLASGGQADVYVRKNTAYKLYNPENIKTLNEKNLWPDISFFSKIKNPLIACPTDILLNAQGSPVGIAMPFCQSNPLSKAFHSQWQRTNNITPQKIETICLQMRSIISEVHAAGALLIDGNELNWLLNSSLQPILIDTDSWAYPNHPALAIMPSIEDPLAHIPKKNNFTQASDWFAWAIVTFQLWTGIHPYKGTHPNYKPNQLIQRIKDGVSVFNSQTQLPPSTRPLSSIPPALLQWYSDTFSHKLRTPPPSSFLATTTPIASTPFRTPTPPAYSASSTSCLFLSTPTPLPSQYQWNTSPTGILYSLTPQALLCTYPSNPSKIITIPLQQTSTSSTPQISFFHPSPTLHPVHSTTSCAVILYSTGDLQVSPLNSATSIATTPQTPFFDTLISSQEGRTFLTLSSNTDTIYELSGTTVFNQLHLSLKPWPVKSLGTTWGSGAFLSFLGSSSGGTPQITTLRTAALTPQSTWTPTLEHAPAPCLNPYKVLDIFALNPYLVFCSTIHRSSGQPQLLHLQLTQNKYTISQSWDLDQPISLNATTFPNSAQSAFLCALLFTQSNNHTLIIAATTKNTPQISIKTAPSLLSSSNCPDPTLFFSHQLCALTSPHEIHQLKLKT